MKQTIKIICLVILLSIFNAYCLYRDVKAVGIEDTYYPLYDRPYKVLGEETVLASNFNLLWLVSVTPPPNIDFAILEAVNRQGGDAMIDIRVWREKEVWVVGTIEIIHIKGKIIKYKKDKMK